MSFQSYAKYYDVYYSNKDYEAEVAFALDLAARFGVQPRTILDMGCGTGRHLEAFAKRGMRCRGFDLSTLMLEQARRRCAGLEVETATGNLTSYRSGEKFDMVVSMFAVMGYLTSNEDLIAGMRTAAVHLKSHGIFIFDGWFGPAVLAQKLEKRRHESREGYSIVTRKADSVLDPVKQCVTVEYEVEVSREGSLVEHIKEDHRMRFMFVQETALAMQAAELELICACPFLEPDQPLSTETWNVSFVARLRKKKQAYGRERIKNP